MNFGHLVILSEGFSCPKYKRLFRQNLSFLHLSGRVVCTQLHLQRGLFIDTFYPDVLVFAKFVVGHEHPSVLAHELYCLDHILYIVVVEKPREIYACVGQSEHLITIIQYFFELSCHLKVQAKHLLPIRRSATAT